MGGLDVRSAVLRGGRAARLGRAVAVELVRRRAGRTREPEPARAPWAQLARQVGASLGQLATATVRPSQADDATGQLARTKRALARAAAAAPALAPGLRRASDSLTRAHDRLGARPLVPVHGAAHLGQWLVDDTGRLGLVDFDRFAWGEPEFDLATFVVELTRAVAGTPTAELETAVVDGFRAVAGEPDEQRLALYILHRRLAKVARTACALRPDAEERAAPLLEKLQSPLDRLARQRPDGDTRTASRGTAPGT